MHFRYWQRAYDQARLEATCAKDYLDDLKANRPPLKSDEWDDYVEELRLAKRVYARKREEELLLKESLAAYQRQDLVE